ncbi:MAG: methylmalonyl Co-A mutase-associated GTPase MeaB [Acidobacteria bacterium]|nr:methylmalonyl Co-A mutase-associated GTPase MeaB [Acidobacteriota bacterium]
MNSEQLITGILQKQPRAIARAISIVENRSNTALPLLQSVFSHTGKALTIGITGSPGAGKSSLVDKLAIYYRKTFDSYVGIIAVDPSSPFSGGAILGDRIRMQTLGLDPKVFIRSMATRGNLGGLARATTDAVAILDAAGFEKIIVETVGVGQDEIDIVKTADVSIVVLMPGMGDDIQAVKAGIMEIADIFVINKADHEGVYRTEKELESLLSISERSDGWQVPIIKTIAIESVGIPELEKAILQYIEFQQNRASALNERRKHLSQQRIIEILKDRLLTKALSKALSDNELDIFAQEVALGHRDPYSIVEEICARLNL